MSEQKTSFMSALDLWIEATIIGPLLEAAPAAQYRDSAEWEEAVEMAKKALRGKVLESYRNGQAAGPARKDHGYAQARAR